MAKGARELSAGATPPSWSKDRMIAIAIAITLAAAGAAVGVAPLGAAFTDTQADQVRPYPPTGRPGIIVATDADAAGHNGVSVNAATVSGVGAAGLVHPAGWRPEPLRALRPRSCSHRAQARGCAGTPIEVRAVLLILLLVAACGSAPARPVPLSYSLSGSGPVVVLLHGHPQTAASWREVIPALDHRYRVLVVDQRGQGASPAPDVGYDARTRAGDVASLMRRLDVRNATVVGTDLGGHTAYALAVDHPDLVRRLVVLEAVLPGTRAASGPLSAPHIAQHANVNAMVQRTLGHEEAHVREFVCAGRDPCPYPADLLTDAAQALRQPGHLAGAFRPYTPLAQAAGKPSRLDVPVLAVGGERGIGSLPAQSLREVAPDVTEVVIPEATHWLAEEHPAQLLAALEPFLAGIAQRPAAPG